MDHWTTHPAPGEGVRYEAALEDAIVDGEYGTAAASVKAVIQLAPGSPCRADAEDAPVFRPRFLRPWDSSAIAGLIAAVPWARQLRRVGRRD